MIAGFAYEEKSAFLFALAAMLAFLSRVSKLTIWGGKEERPTSPGGDASSRGIRGADGRNMDMCDPATVGTASASQCISISSVTNGRDRMRKWGFRLE
jgi:hypothetical protein